MPKSEMKEGKILLSRSEEERIPLVRRLNRIEGQIRGLRLMIEADRYCGEELQQIKAAIAALRGVALILTEQHLEAALALEKGAKSRPIVDDITRVLKEALKI